MQVQANHTTPSSHRFAALALAGTSALALVALSHHPVVPKGNGLDETLVQLVALQWMDGLVHGGLILMLALLAAGYTVFSDLLGRTRAAVRFGMTAYALGCCTIVAAMLFDGFVVPQLARQFVGAAQTDLAVVYVILRAIGTVIQVLTKAGLITMCVAMLAWSWALATGEALPWSRICATLGAAAGFLSGAVLLFADVRLTPHSLMAIFGVHVLFNIAVAAVLLKSAGRSPAKQ